MRRSRLSHSAGRSVEGRGDERLPFTVRRQRADWREAMSPEMVGYGLLTLGLSGLLCIVAGAFTKRRWSLVLALCGGWLSMLYAAGLYELMRVGELCAR